MFHDVVIVTGSLAFDQILNLPGKFSSYILPDKIHQINVSFATDTHTVNFGGTAGNQAYSLALLGIRPVIVATAGYDFDRYRKFLEKNGIDTSYIKIIKNKLTASGFAITDEADNQIWGYSKAAMSDSKDHHLKPVISELSKTNTRLFAILTPCGEEGIANYVDECVAFNIPFAFDPAFYIPSLPKKTLKKGVRYAQIVFGNDYELSLLQKRLSHEKLQGLTLKDTQIVVTTLGENGSVIQQGNKKFTIKPSVVQKVVDPTGAGDAYRAGFMAGFIQGKDLKTCGQMGSVAAAFAVEKKGTMNHYYTKKEFIKRYNENFDPLSF